MSTRHAAADAPLSQNRYMSSPEYIALRGISGTAVTAKASILKSPRQRSLLYFLQAASLNEGGLPAFVERLLAKFPERIGSPTMRKLKVRPEKRYSRSDAMTIKMELGIYDFRDDVDIDIGDETPGAAIIAECRRIAETALPEFIIELCVNPREEIGEPIPYFDNLTAALFEMQEETAQPAGSVVETGVSRGIAATMKEAIARPDRIYMIEGREGIGKSHAAAAWCRENAGVARYVSLSGISSKTQIFRALAKALGLGSGLTRKANEMQTLIEDMLQQSKLLLVVDEAAYLLQAERYYSRPENLDWLYTALTNFRVPIVLLVTSIFGQRLALAERQLKLTWNARQLRRRSKYVRLPDALSSDELMRIASKLLPECGQREAKFVAVYAEATAWPLTSVVDVIEDARYLAQGEGREKIGLKDLDRAIRESREPSEAAQARAFQPVERTSQRRISAALNGRLKAGEASVKNSSRGNLFSVGSLDFAH